VEIFVVGRKGNDFFVIGEIWGDFLTCEFEVLFVVGKNGNIFFVPGKLRKIFCLKKRKNFCA
jgi:hypothetical protein